MPRFTILREGQPPRSVSFLLQEVRIGRLPDLEIPLGTPSVSRVHARIRSENGAWWLVDDMSMNGTHVGGRRVRRCELRPGDRIHVEGWVVVFEPDDALYGRGLAESPETKPGAAFGQTFLSAGRFAARNP